MKNNLKVADSLKKRNVQIMLIDCLIIFLTSFTAFFVSNAITYVHLSVQLVLPEIVLSVIFTVAAMLIGRAYKIIWKYANAREFFMCIIWYTTHVNVYVKFYVNVHLIYVNVYVKIYIMYT